MANEPATRPIVKGIGWWLVEWTSGLLEPDERDAVRGDLTELGMTGTQALQDLLGLVVRRQLGFWTDWRPWVALLTVTVPIGLLLSHVVRWWADSSAIYAWLYANNWTWNFLTIPGARHDLAHYSTGIFLEYLSLIAWSWTSGFVLGCLARRTLWITGLVFSLVVVAGAFGTTSVARANGFNSAVFSTTFYGTAFPLILRTVLVLLPAFLGVRRSLRSSSLPLLRAILGALAVAILTLWTAKGLESSMIFGRGVIPPDAGPDGLMGTADDPRPLRLLPLVMMWPVVYIVAITSWRHWRGQPSSA